MSAWSDTWNKLNDYAEQHIEELSDAGRKERRNRRLAIFNNRAGITDHLNSLRNLDRILEEMKQWKPPTIEEVMASAAEKAKKPKNKFEPVPEPDEGNPLFKFSKNHTDTPVVVNGQPSYLWEKAYQFDPCFDSETTFCKEVIEELIWDRNTPDDIFDSLEILPYQLFYQKMYLYSGNVVASIRREGDYRTGQESIKYSLLSSEDGIMDMPRDMYEADTREDVAVRTGNFYPNSMEVYEHLRNKKIAYSLPSDIIILDLKQCKEHEGKEVLVPMAKVSIAYKGKVYTTIDCANSLHLPKLPMSVERQIVNKNAEGNGFGISLIMLIAAVLFYFFTPTSNLTLPIAIGTFVVGVIIGVIFNANLEGNSQDIRDFEKYRRAMRAQAAVQRYGFNKNIVSMRKAHEVVHRSNSSQFSPTPYYILVAILLASLFFLSNMIAGGSYKSFLSGSLFGSAAYDSTIVNGIDSSFVRIRGGNVKIEDAYIVDSKGNAAPNLYGKKRKERVSSFEITDIPITKAQWKEVMDEFSIMDEVSQSEYSKVKMNEALEFIRRLNELTGKHYSLPTQAQMIQAWEKGRCKLDDLTNALTSTVDPYPSYVSSGNDTAYISVCKHTYGDISSETSSVGCIFLVRE